MSVVRSEPLSSPSSPTRWDRCLLYVLLYLVMISGISCNGSDPEPDPIAPIEGNWTWMSTGQDIAPFYRTALGYDTYAQFPDTVFAEFRPDLSYQFRIKYVPTGSTAYIIDSWGGQFTTEEDPFEVEKEIRVLKLAQRWPIEAQLEGIYQIIPSAAQDTLSQDSLKLEVVQVSGGGYENINRPPVPPRGFGSTNYHLDNHDSLFGENLVQRFVKVPQ